MKDKNPLLLPSGLYDLLPPNARVESEATAGLLSCFASFGYAQVSPPLLEFEASLLSGRGEAMSAETFRVMDPLSHVMMGFRADMTLQVGRIAATRMQAQARPLRLCYAGPILRVKPEALESERQLMQAGVELIGSDAWEADAEVMIVAAEALALLGVSDISIDLNLTGLLSELCGEAKDDAPLRARIKDAVQRRDAGAIAALPLKKRDMLAKLITLAGPADKALKELRTLKLAQAEDLKNVTARIAAHCPKVSLTIDPLEYRGFDYHQGIGFSIFARGLRHELGRGGRYRVAGDNATGFTFYVTHLLPLLKPGKEEKRILMPQEASPESVRKLRAEGWVTIGAMSDDLPQEAKQLAIGNIWHEGKVAEG
jgi:ATP phosphoribosyltransferase regulatory subunit